MPSKAIFRTRGFAILWLLGICLLSGWLIAGTGRSLSINTNVMDLLPQSGRDIAVYQAVDRIKDRFERHLAILVGANDLKSAVTASQRVAARLKATGYFSSVTFDDYRNLALNAVSFYTPRRFQILSNETINWLESGDIASFEKSVLERYYGAHAAISSALIERDPLFLLPRFLEERASAASGRPTVRGDYLTVEDRGRIYVVILAELRNTPFSITLQKELMPVIKGLKLDLMGGNGNFDVLTAGVLPHAAAGTEGAVEEISTVGLGSLLGIVVILFVLFRSPRPFLLTILSIAMGSVAGVAACHAVFGEVHLMTLIFGASLVGISVDYSLHYFCERYRFTGDWSPFAALRHIYPGITLGLITSLIGFAGLFFAPFPGMQGMAVFSCVGLAVAYSCVVFCYPHFTQTMRQPGTAGVLRLARRYGDWWARQTGWRIALAAAALLIVSAVGCVRLTATDDIRLLQTPDPDVMREETRTRDLIGRNLASQFFLVEGRDEESFLAAEEQLTKLLRQLKAQHRLDGYIAISDFVPSAKRQRENVSLIKKLVSGTPSLLDRIAETVGLPPPLVQNYKDAVRDAERRPPTTIAAWLADPVSKPYRHLWLGKTDRGVIGVVGLRGVYDPAILRDIAHTDPAFHFVDPADDISKMFGKYRHKTIWLTLLSYAVVLLVLIARYELAGGLRVMATPTVATVVTLGVLGFLGENISLFNVMAMFLVLGIGVDYALFFRETGAEHPTTLLAIALSSLTTILAFGLLTLSATMAIHAFGLTILVGILVAFLVSPSAGPKAGTTAQETVKDPEAGQTA